MYDLPRAACPTCICRSRSRQLTRQTALLPQVLGYCRPNAEGDHRTLILFTACLLCFMLNPLPVLRSPTELVALVHEASSVLFGCHIPTSFFLTFFLSV